MTEILAEQNDIEIKYTKGMPCVAVLLAAYNGKKWLQEQLDTILGQKNVNVTIFISVDTSTDGTESFVDELALTFTNIKILPHGMYFGSAAPNFFRLIKDIDFGRFDYISFSDQDDIWLPEKLSRACSMIEEKTVDGYSSNVIAFWPSGRQVLIEKAQPQRQYDYLFEAAGPGCTYVVSQRLGLEIQEKIIKNWEDVQNVCLHDWFIYAYARANSYRWFIDEKVGMSYRQHNNNQVGANYGLRMFFSRIKKITNCWAFNQAALITKIIGCSDSDFVQRWINGTRYSFLFLITHASKCRRRLRDRIFFEFACILMLLIGCKE